MADIITETSSHRKINGSNQSKIHPSVPPHHRDYHEVEWQVSKDHFAVDDTASLNEEVAKTQPWSEVSTAQKTVRVLTIVLKASLVLMLLYFFICSLDLLSVGLRIVGGRRPSQLLGKHTLLQNPVVGLMCGILFTIIVQSSSTTSSAVVGLVAGKFITVQVAIPIIMGANIGTSVTNTLLAMVQVDDRDRFRRAFAAATIHDMFNWLTTLILLPFESLTGYLYHTSGFLVRQIQDEEHRKNHKQLKLLKALTEPLTKKIIKLTNKVSDTLASNETMFQSMADKQGTVFAESTWSEHVIGLVVVAVSFVVLLTCLYCIVKTLKSILKGKMAVWIRHTSTANLPYCPSLTEYLLIMMGAVLTFLVQSSSVFTSTLPPLVSVKAISLERAYPLTLGANLGTTTTALIAALTQTKNISEGLQIALCHLLFNISGVCLFYPLPCTRFPIRMAKSLGNTTAQYRWFAILYVIVLFILLPLLFMGLAFAGSIYVISVASVLLVCILCITIINSLREYPRFLPKMFHTWNWLPKWVRSLEPYDRLFSKLACCVKLKRMSLPMPGRIDRQEEGEEGAGTESTRSIFQHNTIITVTDFDEGDNAQSVDSEVINKESVNASK